jgi:sucrose phosphorylase
MRDGVQLIAYADRLGGTLPALERLLTGPLAGLFTGVHVLPFYRPYDGADAGFDPDDHLSVDPRLGDWDDVRALGEAFDVTADLIVNHASDRSPAFRDVVAHGDRSSYAGMFLTFDTVFGSGATEADLVRITRPRPGLPFTPVVLGGRKRLAWTTFTAHQIDLDVRNAAARAYLSDVLRCLASNAVTTVRLDAVGYAVKTPGTTCFLTPDTLAFAAELAAEARRLGLRVLAEVHAPTRSDTATAAVVDQVYDFTLAPAILHAVSTGDDGPLRDWLRMRPDHPVTVLETHDGIGLVDAVGLLSTAQITALERGIHRNSGGTSRMSTMPDGTPYQISCTAYDAIGRNDRRYLLARALQLFVPGIPQVYYVGLLAGRNTTGVTGDAREINRRSYSETEVVAAMRRPVVRRLTRLIRLRTTHPAFRGDFTVEDGAGDELVLAWQAGPARAELRVHLADATFRVRLTERSRRAAPPPG